MATGKLRDFDIVKPRYSIYSAIEVDPEQEKIITYEDVLLKKSQLIDGTPVTGDRNYNSRCWMYTGPLPGREQCLFTMGAWGGGDERLWLFDPLKDIYSGVAFEPIAHIGSTFHEIAIGGERLYFIQYEDLEDQRTIMTEKAREEDPDIVGYNDNLPLRSISLRKGDDRSIYDHGKLVGQEGRAARMITSMTADAKGRIFMTGSWYIKSDREASFQVLFADFPGERIYKLVKRGEIFAVVETAIDD
jgi:hypothetical protein